MFAKNLRNVLTGDLSTFKKLTNLKLLGLTLLCLALLSNSQFSILNSQFNSPCLPTAPTFRGYSFLLPEIVNHRAAYAPYFLDFGDRYAPYFQKDLQRDENLEEWIGRFCIKVDPEDVAEVVYRSPTSTLTELLRAAGEKGDDPIMPFALDNSPFAKMLAVSKCTEVIEYLIFAKKCEPHVVAKPGWDFKKRDTTSMQLLVQEGLARFKMCKSQFVRLRYSYQIVRLAHYSGRWQQTVDLYNRLLPQIERRRPSIVFFWTLGHLAGALQKQGKLDEAAYRYSLIFRNCASKRTQAWRSFFIKNDAVWAGANRLCESQAEKATLLAMRAGRVRTTTLADMQAIYALEPEHPSLDLLLVGEVQLLEKSLLRSAQIENKHGAIVGALKKEAALKRLAALQVFVNQVIKENKVGDQHLWQCLRGYLLLLGGKPDEATYQLNLAESQLQPDSPETNDAVLKKQIAVWRTLLQIQQLPLQKTDSIVGVIQLSKPYEDFPPLGKYLNDLMAERYADFDRPGKAFLANYTLGQLAWNPSLGQIDDILSLQAKELKTGIESKMTRDTSMGELRAKLLEIKAMNFFAKGQPEAALATFRLLTTAEQAALPKFSPFVYHTNDCRVRCQYERLNPMSRMEIIEQMGQLEFDAKAEAATGKEASAAKKFYLIGLGLYNMSWFGYEWEAFDALRDGDNWWRLAGHDVVFPYPGSPNGNLENLDVSRSLSMLEEALRLSSDPELSAKIAFCAAKCRLAQWFCSEGCKYRPGTRQIPDLPEAYRTYQDLLLRKYSGTKFFGQVVLECKWFGAYARRN